MLTNNEKVDFIISLSLFNEKFNKNKENIDLKEFEDNYLLNIPKSLYKYRECKDTHIKAFENDEIYFSNPTEFSDTLDALAVFDEKSEIEYFYEHQEEMYTKLAKKFLANVVYINEREIRKKINIDGIVQILIIDNCHIIDKRLNYDVHVYCKV